MKEKVPIPIDKLAATADTFDTLDEYGQLYTLAFAAGYAAAMDAVKSMLKEAKAG